MKRVEIVYKCSTKGLPQYDGKEFTFIKEFSDTMDAETIAFIYCDGNWSCDCNRSLDIQHNCDKDFPELECSRQEYQINIIKMTALDFDYDFSECID